MSPFARLRGPSRLFFAAVTLLTAVLRGATPPPAPDALVVGAGIAGLSAAWELAQGGARVTVIDMASVFGGHAIMAEGVLNLTGTPMQAAQGIRDTPEPGLPSARDQQPTSVISTSPNHPDRT